LLSTCKLVLTFGATCHLFRWPVVTVSSPSIYGKIRQKRNSQMHIVFLPDYARRCCASQTLAIPYMDNAGRPAGRTRSRRTRTQFSVAEPLKFLHGKMVDGALTGRTRDTYVRPPAAIDRRRRRGARSGTDLARSLNRKGAREMPTRRRQRALRHAPH
jgi:hypothetical protein